MAFIWLIGASAAVFLVWRYMHKTPPMEKAHIIAEPSSGWTIIIPGITGDLAQRKLLPALYALHQQGIKLCVVGTGRHTAEVSQILAKSRLFIAGDAPDWETFVKAVSYYQLNDQTRAGLLPAIKTQEQTWGFTGKRVVYLATPADTFCSLTEQFVSLGVVHPGREQYMLYEKPFGRDEQSARELDACLKQYLPAMQLYRVDHYASHEYVALIPAILEGNALFSRVLFSDVATIRVIFYETLGVEGRGAFYDRYGAARDVLQNHALHILASCAGADALRLLSSLVVTEATFGQYEGYLAERDVVAGSQTETYARIVNKSKDPAWAHITFVLETGKAMAAKRTALIITLKNGEELALDIAPTSRITCTLRVPSTVLMSPELPVTHGPYERVFLDIFSGSFASAISSEEIFAQWRIIDAAYRLKGTVFDYSRGWTGEKRKNI